MGDSLETAYWILAIAGTLLFVAKTVLLVLGAGDHDLAADAADFDATHTHTHHPSDAAFTLLSMQSISTLAMGTGWMGLLTLLSFGLNPMSSIVLALAFGFLLVFLMGNLMRSAKKLESSGTLDLKTAIGATGTVYVGIPEKGRGQVQVVVQGRLSTLDAVTIGPAFASGSRVRVESVDPSGMLVVGPSSS